MTTDCNPGTAGFSLLLVLLIAWLLPERGLTQCPVFVQQPPATFTVCAGQPIPPTLATVSATGATTYQWQRLVNLAFPVPPIYADIPGQTSAVLTPFWTTPPTGPVAVRCLATGGGCSTGSNQMIIAIGVGGASCGSPPQSTTVWPGNLNVALAFWDDRCPCWSLGLDSVFAVGDPFANYGTLTSAGTVALYRGAQGVASLHWVLGGQASNDQFGASVAMGDIDGNGSKECFVGAPGRGGGAGAIYQIVVTPSGLFSVNLTSVLAYQGVGTSGLGRLLAFAPYLDNDGKHDFVTTSLSDRLLAFSGSNFAQLWQVVAPAHIETLDVLADINGDGYDDVAIGMPSLNQWRGLVQIRSGRDGALLRSHGGAVVGESLGSQVASLRGDIDFDGVADYVISSPDHSNQGVVSFWSGATGAFLDNRWGSQPGRRYGASLSCSGAGNGDRFPDVLIGAPGTVSTTAVGITELVSGLDRQVLRVRHGASSFGYRVASLNPAFNGNSVDLVADEVTLTVTHFGEPVPIPPSTVPVGRSRVLGQVCPDSSARLARASAPMDPPIPTQLQVNLDSAPADMPAVMMFSLNALETTPAWWASLPTADCRLTLGDTFAMLAGATDSFGRMRPSIPIAFPWGPNNVKVQFAILDLGQPPQYVPLVTSNVLRLSYGL